MLFNECISCKNYDKELLFFSVSRLSERFGFAIAIPNTIECNNNASQKGVSTAYIIHGQFVGVTRLNAY